MVIPINGRSEQRDKLFIFVILILAILTALLLGGKITHLADLKLEWRGLILVGFLIQILIFNNFWQKNLTLQPLSPFLYIASLGLLLIALAKNQTIPGMKIITLGFLLNSLAITLNGGYMPASVDALITSGWSHQEPGQIYNNSIAAGPNTLLPFLGDIFAIPRGFIFPNVFSIGDVLIAIGAVYLLHKTMVKPRQK